MFILQFVPCSHWIIGVEPDIEVDFDVDLFYSTGYDTQLERALQYIETGN